MKKMNQKALRLLCVTAVLLVCLTLAAVGMAQVTSASTTTHTLTVKLDAVSMERVDSCYLVYAPDKDYDYAKTVKAVETDDGYQFSGIAANSEVNLYILTRPGYDSDVAVHSSISANGKAVEMTRLETPDSSSAYYGMCHFSTFPYGDDCEFSFTFNTRAEYAVSFIGFDRGNPNYTMPGYTVEKYTCGTALALPDDIKFNANVDTTDLEFRNEWKIMGDRESVICTVVPSGGKFYIPEEIALTEENADALMKAHKARTLYVYPVHYGKHLEIARDDYVMLNGKILTTDGTLITVADKKNADRSNWLKLGSGLITSDGGIRAYTEKVTGLDQFDATEVAAGEQYKAYDGYRVVTDPKLYKGFEKYILSANDRIVRFYEPLTYTLGYEPENGGTLTSTKYVYSTDCNVAVPTMRGHDFLGWKITATINNRTKTYTADEVERKGNSGFITYTRDENGRIKSAKILGGMLYPEFASEDQKLTLTATWAPSECRIDYALDDVKIEADIKYNKENLPASFTYGSADASGGEQIKIPVPQRSGYTFDCWYIYYKNTDGEWVTSPDKYARDVYPEKYGLDGSFYLSTTDYASDVKLEPQWTPNGYRVVLDPNDAQTAITTPIAGTSSLGDTVYTFDQPFEIKLTNFITPLCTGYTFDGYWSRPTGGKQYIKADGTAIPGVKWTEYEVDENGNAVLYAHWTAKKFKVNFSLEDSLLPEKMKTEDVKVFIQKLESIGSDVHSSEDDVWSDWAEMTEAETYDFGTQFRFRIECPEGYKSVSLIERSIGEMRIRIHANPFVTEAQTLGAYPKGDGSVEGREGDMLYSVRICPMIEPLSPDELADHIDYINETIGGFPDGSFRLMLGDAILEVTVKDGKITETGQTYAPIHDAFFGHDVELYRCGDGIMWADSAPMPLHFNARPEAPASDVFRVDSSAEDRLHVSLAEGETLDLTLYEFAVSHLADPSLLSRDIWQSEAKDLFKTGVTEEDVVRPGTTYYVFVRVKATTDAPHGEECILLASPTAYAAYREARLAYLNNLLNEDFCGESVKKLINATKVSIETLITSIEAGIEDGSADMAKISVWRDVEAILTVFEEELILAKYKDSAESVLAEFLTVAEANRFYTDKNLALLKDYRNTALPFIRESTVREEVDLFREQALAQMRAVPRAAIVDSDGRVRVESERGLPYLATLTLTRHDPIADSLLDGIRRAIRNGKLEAYDGNTEGAKQLLSSLDVVAYYSFTLENAVLKMGDKLTVRLAIPEDLRDETGLRVAYYDGETGELLLLASDEVERDGDELVFYAEEIRDFAILADPTVQLGGFIVALSILLLCQLAAIVLLLMNYLKRRRNATHASLALPVMALAVKFAPVGADIALLIMGLLAIILQAVLILLILRLKPVYVGHGKRKASVADDEEALEEEEEDSFEEEEDSFDEEALDDGEEDTDDEQEAPIEKNTSYSGTAFDEDEDDEAFGTEELYMDEDDRSADAEEAPIDEPHTGRIFISEDGEVFYGDEYERAGMKEFNAAGSDPTDEEDALFDLEEEDAPADKDTDEDDEVLYKYDE